MRISGGIAMKITFDAMKEFYMEEFDSINIKYHLTGEPPKKYLNIRPEIENYEKAFQFAALTKTEYGEALKSLDLIYANAEKSNDVLALYDAIRNKVICQYINIDGLERLFSEKYIDFEWEMHLGVDHQIHNMTFYRDHFIHQMRNAYCMHQMLIHKEINWMEKIKKVLKTPANSKVSQYVCQCVEQQKMTHSHSFIDGKGFLYAYKNNANKEDFYYENIILMSCYIAALFHDMGYPETNNIINQKRITEYIANLYNAESSGYNYARLNALLQNSLLFRVVPFREIQWRITKPKPDHGALSAVMFLMNFYENGAIQGLEPYKKCAVELAALAIYNHTNHYANGDKMEPFGYERISFMLNPITYLLRICDDLQEWDRVYFELSNKSNLILCNQCKTPIVRKTDSLSKQVYYSCHCNYEQKDQSIFSPVFSYINNFPYRRIYSVTVCKELSINEKNNALIFHLEYQLDHLLHIAYINSSYGKYRVNELNKLKPLFNFQWNLPPMYLDYFVTPNPVLIKTMIVAKYLENKIDAFESKTEEILSLFEECIKIEEYSNKDICLEDIEPNMEDINHFSQKSDDVFEQLLNVLKEIIFKIYNKRIEFSDIKIVVYNASALYTKLAVLMYLFRKSNTKYWGHPKQQKLIEESFKKWSNEKIVEIYARGEDNSDVKALILDCIEQFSRMYNQIETLPFLPDAYYKQFEVSEYTYACIQRFISTGNYPLKINPSLIQIDAFTDMELFKHLLNN